MTFLIPRLLVFLSNVYRRILVLVLWIIGPRVSYGFIRVLSRWMYRLLDSMRSQCEKNCEAALGDTFSEDEIRDIAEHSFIHRCWNQADLMLASAKIRKGTFAKYGGTIPEPYLGMILDAQKRYKPLILVTGYYGPYDLLPLFLGYNGIRAGAVYRPHPNPGYDLYRKAVRSRSGLEMVPVDRAAARVPQILLDGGIIAILADHHVEKRGVPVSYLDRETTSTRFVGLLASHFEAIVVVAGIRRRQNAFRFELVIEDLFDQTDWKDHPDPVRYITERYVAGQERMILEDPSQYLWTHPRWGADPALPKSSEIRPARIHD